MATFRVLLSALALVGAVSAADSMVAQAAARAEQKAALAPKSIALEFHLQIAQALKDRDPALSRKLLDFILTELRAGKDLTLSPGMLQALAELYPERAVDFQPQPRASAAQVRSASPPAPPEVASISKRMSTMRSLPTDADRSRLTLELIRDIRALPAGPRQFGLISSLSHVATEGDLGKEAMSGVATTLAAAMRDKGVIPSAGDYIGLATLARYEHLDVPSDAALEAALALLELREQIQQENGFKVTGMDGKTYSLASLKGRIVLLNFWATWCPPCRKEMPDMEKLYRAYEKRGLTVIAVSDEDRPTVEQFLAKNAYSFPVALDPGREVNKAFNVDGIPKSFIFDREGRLAAQAIDMRTETQFMQLLKLAGLE
ncbi:MAG: TlpA disulfide reductase family protein [Candidatus Solibacter sp.]